MGETRVEEMEAGREIDAAVAVAWLGWRWVKDALNRGESYLLPPDMVAAYLPEYVGDIPHAGQKGSDRWHRDLPRCSEEMGAAWKLVEAVSAETHWYALWWRPTGAVANFYGFDQDNTYATFDECGGSREKCQALAICRAALKVAEGLKAKRA